MEVNMSSLFTSILNWSSTRKKVLIETVIFISLGVAILCFILEKEVAGRWLLAFFFISFIALLIHDGFKFFSRKLKGRKR
jgi:hypothetical protein